MIQLEPLSSLDSALTSRNNQACQRSYYPVELDDKMSTHDVSRRKRVGPNINIFSLAADLADVGLARRTSKFARIAPE